MDIKQVAQYLNCSERTVHKYRQEGRLSVVYKKAPGKRGSGKGFYNEEEVKRLKQELYEPTYLSIPEVASGLMQENTGINLSEDDLNCIKDAFSAWGYNQYLAGLQQKLLLRINEAADLSGLSKTGIKRAIKENRLPAIKEGRAWKISKKNLDSFIAIEYQ